MNLCEYGCGQEAKYKTSNNRQCCSPKFNSCPGIRKRNSETNKIKQSGKNNPMYGREQTIESKLKNSESNKKVWKDKSSTFNNPQYRKKLKKALIEASKKRKRTIKMLKEKYTLFSKIEEMRYNPDKPKEKEIQVHCKNHNCSNSKEQGGWFTPTNIQLYERIRNVEHHGLDNSYYYCSQKCKNECPLFNLHSDPFKNNEIPYTSQEYQTFRNFVLERDDYKCQYCEDLATDVHHERSQKLEPFFALDPNLAWSCCEKCHYTKGHKDECSTGALANRICTDGVNNECS